jgi:hypothetical protein
MTTFKPGEIYLVREFDFTSKKESRYAKIGLVYSPRKSTSRLKEHQTGNPNILRIADSEIVQTEAVNWVEAMLHRIFAKHRVSGEWFELTPSLREKVLLEARNLCNEAKVLPKLLSKADALAETLDNSKSIKPKPQILELASKLLLAKMQMKVLSPLQKQINSIFKKAIESGAEIAGAAEVQEKTYAAKLLKDNQELLKKEHPAIYAKFVGIKAELYRQFNFTYKQSGLSLSADFLKELDLIKSMIGAVERDFDPYIANEANLMVTDLVTVAERQRIFSDLALRVECGKNFEIEEVCNWPRRMVDRETFDVQKFVKKHKELSEKYLKASWTETYVNAVKRKAQ